MAADFYEDDEPAGEVRRAFDEGEKRQTEATRRELAVIRLAEPTTTTTGTATVTSDWVWTALPHRRSGRIWRWLDRTLRALAFVAVVILV